MRQGERPQGLADLMWATAGPASKGFLAPAVVLPCCSKAMHALLTLTLSHFFLPAGRYAEAIRQYRQLAHKCGEQPEALPEGLLRCDMLCRLADIQVGGEQLPPRLHPLQPVPAARHSMCWCSSESQA